ncbi:uncharacterized protein LOC132635330 [Lycium barbarum]|uniref:uncharacterized protein LOC132635330 n=1 Tax=Lycium barbarum TaxID=112863 RepID=UPI00293EDA3E|nr:uncharacterized protein LOC132635330 [Lycium barbarum]
MHRQSLGSPASKLHLAGGIHDSAVITAAESTSLEEDEQVRRSIKALNKSLFRAEKYIHLIPVLTFFCFLILYLSSHNPSDKDLAQFHGYEGFAKPIESANIDELQRVLEIGKGDVLAIRSVRNLQEIDPKNRLHRKLADF